MIDIIIKNGANVHAVDEFQNTPVYAAAFSGETILIFKLRVENSDDKFAPDFSFQHIRQCKSCRSIDKSWGKCECHQYFK